MMGLSLSPSCAARLACYLSMLIMVTCVPWCNNAVLAHMQRTVCVMSPPTVRLLPVGGCRMPNFETTLPRSTPSILSLLPVLGTPTPCFPFPEEQLPGEQFLGNSNHCLVWGTWGGLFRKYKHYGGIFFSFHLEATRILRFWSCMKFLNTLFNGSIATFCNYGHM
jgi:hypothetical protein